MSPELVDHARAALTADGVPADHLAVTSGALDGIERALTAHLRPGDRVAVEDPGWANLLDLLAALGLSAEPVRVDDDGPLVADMARALGRGVRALVVTTRAQNPTGAALSADRAGDATRPAGRPGRRSAARRGRPLRGHLRCAAAHVGRVDSALGVRAVGIEGLRPRPAGRRPGRRPPHRRARARTTAAGAGLGESSAARSRGQLVVGRRRDAPDRSRPSSSTPATARDCAPPWPSAACTAHGRSGLNVWIPVPDETVAITRLLSAGWAAAPGTRFRIRTEPGIRITIADLTDSEIDPLADAVAEAVLSTGRRYV